jgi:hypothetical protein
MVSTCNFWLNIFPPKDGISRNINPIELITGVKIDYNKHIQAEFGEYVQVHEEHDNTMHNRTTGAIATKPTGNAKGRLWFYSLATGRRLNRRRWTPLPMPSDVIETINILAKASQAGMNFTNMRSELYYDNEDDESDSDDDSDTESDYNSDDASSDDDSEDDYDDFIAGVDKDNTGNSNPDIEESDENNNKNDRISAGQGDDGALDDVSLSKEEMNEDVPTSLKKLSDDTGALPPIIQSRTQKQARETGESLMTGAEAIKTVKKKTAQIQEGIADPSAQERGRRKKKKAQKKTEK